MPAKEHILSVDARRIRGQPPKIAIEGLASEILEAQLIPDPYCYTVDPERGLLEPFYSRPIWDFVTERNPVEAAEKKAVGALEKWGKRITPGSNEIMLWISPPRPDSPCAKFTISTIEELPGKRRLKNTAILNTLSSQICLQIANRLSEFSPNSRTPVEDPEVLRATPLIIQLPEETSWPSFLAEFIPASWAWEKIKTAEHETEKEQARKIGERVFLSVQRQEMLSYIEIPVVLRTGEFLSQTTQHFYSCPPSSILLGPLEAVLSAAKIFTAAEAKYVKNCGRCGGTINKIIPAGYKCPSCGGIYLGC
ncbi:MAG: hypothetical protein HYS83_00045 [Candidatus Blackburnbacteria bacterium]|nr:hypothetical protein [Candidatus Blackburnbacteria bacterium]